MESPQCRFSSPGKSSAELKRRTFSETRTSSIHEESPQENIFFRGALKKNDYTNEVISELSGSRCNGEDEGIGHTDAGAAHGYPNAPWVLHSMSAPSGHHKVLNKDSFEADSKYHRGKSLEEARGLSRDEEDEPVALGYDDSGKARRKSFKDSALGSSEGSIDTGSQDGGSVCNVTKRRVSQPKVSRMVSKDLGTVCETPEHQLKDKPHNGTTDVSVPKPHNGTTDGSVTAADDDSSQVRRRSYQDSALGSSEGITDTCIADDVFVSEKRRVSRTVSKDLGTVTETPEHHHKPHNDTTGVSVPRPHNDSTDMPVVPKPHNDTTDVPVVPKPHNDTTQVSVPKPHNDATGVPVVPKPHNDTTGVPVVPKPHNDTTGVPVVPKPHNDTTEVFVPKTHNDTTGVPVVPKTHNDTTGVPVVPKPHNNTTRVPVVPKPHNDTTEVFVPKPHNDTTGVPVVPKPHNDATGVPVVPKPHNDTTGVPVVPKPHNDTTGVPVVPKPHNDTTEVFVPNTHRPLSEQKTPDFDVLQPRSVCSSESSGSSNSEKDPTSATPRTPGLHPLFEELISSSASSMGYGDQPELSPQLSDVDKEDYVFYNGHPGVDDQVDIASLEPALSHRLGGGMRGGWFQSAEGPGSPLLPPGEPLSLPSLDNAPMREADLRRLYRRCRYRWQIQHIIRSMKRGAQAENIMDIIHRVMSDSDHASSDFSSIGSGTHSLHGSSSGSTSDHPPGTFTMPLAPRPATIISEPSVELASQYESSSYDTEPSVPSFDSEGKLERAACCRQSTCTDQQCQEGQRLILYINHFLDQSTIFTRYHDNILLRTIAEHANLCDELKCPIPWCTFFHEHDLPFEEQVATLHAAYFSGQINMTSEDSEVNEVEILRPLDCGCKEHVDWSGIALLGGYGNAVLAMTSSLDNPAYWVVKRENKDVLLHVDVLRKLKGKFHPRIVQHLWILEQENYLFIASKFEGASVADRMSEAGHTGLPEGRVLTYMEQLASATRFLQRENLNIAYLNWTAENVLLSADGRFVKLCNFSCAVLMEEVQDDEERLEDLKMLLPPRIVPPELYAGKSVTATSDVWGLGCVWYQMTTGHLLYPQYCHFHPATVRDKLEDGAEPDLTEVPEHTRIDLCQCLHMDPCARITTPELHTRLIEARETPPCL